MLFATDDNPHHLSTLDTIYVQRDGTFQIAIYMPFSIYTTVHHKWFSAWAAISIGVCSIAI